MTKEQALTEARKLFGDRARVERRDDAWSHIGTHVVVERRDDWDMVRGRATNWADAVENARDSVRMGA